MAVEIGTLVLKGRFGPARSEAAPEQPDMSDALEAMRRELMREIADKLAHAERRAWER